MKIKKHIAKLLLVGMLANNFSVLSNAGTLSPDTRYETFEGDFIEIDDVLEEDKMDIRHGSVSEAVSGGDRGSAQEDSGGRGEDNGLGTRGSCHLRQQPSLLRVA